MSSKSIDQFSENISGKALETYKTSLNDGNGDTEAFSTTVEMVSSNMLEIGVSSNIVDSISESLVEVYHNAIGKGISLQDAAEIALESINSLLKDNNVTLDSLSEEMLMYQQTII